MSDEDIDGIAGKVWEKASRRLLVAMLGLILSAAIPGLAAFWTFTQYFTRLEAKIESGVVESVKAHEMHEWTRDAHAQNPTLQMPDIGEIRKRLAMLRRPERE